MVKVLMRITFVIIIIIEIKCFKHVDTNKHGNDINIGNAGNDIMAMRITMTEIIVIISIIILKNVSRHKEKYY